MESAVFHLNSNDFDNRFVESVKTLFKDRRIKVIVTEETDDNALTENELLAVVERNRKANYHYDVPSADFKTLVAQFRADEDFDIADAIATYKTDK